VTLSAVTILIAYAIAALIGYAGYRARALTWDGAAAACLVGGTVFGFGGLGCAVLLVLFFASSSALSFFKSGDERKRQAAETFEKGGKRDAAQVLANGGIAALAAVLICLLGDPALIGAFVGALAAATADTWATEIGVLSRSQPRLVSTGQVVPAGTSGAVTWLGTGAALAGAGLMGVAAALLALLPVFPAAAATAGQALSLVPAALLGGAAGMLADSLLGATVQASYICPRCGKPTESRVHSCGTPTRLVRGLAWVSNDLVNVAGTLVGALVGWLTVFWLR
jgi:uncharacterized protein (TIGR00297 family)